MSHPRTCLLAALALLTALTADARAGGPCAAKARAVPERPGSGLGRPPLFIGDSSMLLGVPALARLGFRANARGCRSGTAAVRLLARHRRRHRLRLAVLAVGANGGLTAATLRRARRLMRPRGMLGLVTGAGSPAAPRTMRRFARAHPRDTVLVDWRATRPWRYGGDGIHIGTRGEAAQARFVHRHVRPWLPPSRALARAVPRRIPDSSGCGTVHGLAVFVVRGDVGCARALAVARRPLRRPGGGWRAHDWRVAGRPPFTRVLDRRRPRVVLAMAPA